MFRKTILALLIFFWCTTLSGSKIAFTTLEKGHYASGITDAFEEVIYGPRVFFNFFHRIHQGEMPAPITPEVDFENEMVIAVSPGPKMSGGYDVEIIDINEIEGKLLVLITLKEPGPDESVTEALTQPHHIISTSKSDEPVEFKWEKR